MAQNVANTRALVAARFAEHQVPFSDDTVVEDWMDVLVWLESAPGAERVAWTRVWAKGLRCPAWARAFEALWALEVRERGWRVVQQRLLTWVAQTSGRTRKPRP